MRAIHTTSVKRFVTIRLFHRGKTACIPLLSVRFAPPAAVRLANGNQPVGGRAAGVAASPALRPFPPLGRSCAGWSGRRRKRRLRAETSAIRPASLKRIIVSRSHLVKLMMPGMAKAGRFVTNARPLCRIPRCGSYKPLICSVFV